jgi:hypothetical protein
MGMPRYKSFSDLTDPITANALSSLYEGDIDKCDLFVCGLAESKSIGRDSSSTR